MTTAVRTRPAPGPVGIAGWLALLALSLCLSLLADSVEFFNDFLPVTFGEWQRPRLRIPAAIILVVYAACMVVNVWALLALFRKKKSFRRVYLLLWILSASAQASVLTLLAVPGVTAEAVFSQMSGRDVLRAIAEQVRYALWFWYLSVSVRVRNTMTA